MGRAERNLISVRVLGSATANVRELRNLNSLVHEEGIYELPGMEKNWRILGEILIKTQPITLPLKKENERARKHLLWVREGLLKGVGCGREEFASVWSRSAVLPWARLEGMGPMARSVGLGVCSQQGNRRGPGSVPCTLSSLQVAWKLGVTPAEGLYLMSPPHVSRHWCFPGPP